MALSKAEIAQKKAKYERQGLPKDEISRRLAQAKVSAQVSAVAPSRQKQRAAARGYAHSAGKENPYLACLLDPEHQPAVGVPDAFSGLSHVCRIFTQRQLAFDANNVSKFMVTRDLEDHLYYTPAPATAITIGSPTFRYVASSLMEIDYGSQRAGEGYSYRERLIDYGNTIYSAFAAASVTTAAGVSFGCAAMPFHKWGGSSNIPSTPVQRTVDGVYHYMQCRQNDTVYYYVSSNNTTANNVTVTVRFILSGGTFSNVTVVAAAATNQLTIPVVAPANTVGVIDFAFAPCALANVILQTVAWNINIAGAAEAEYMVSVPIGKDDGSEFSTIRNDSTAYRVVAQSVWLQYFGSLTSNGNLAIVHRNNKIDHNDFASFDESSIVATPGNYRGPMIKGAYCFRKPLDNSDLEFTPMDIGHRSDAPITGILTANDVNAQNVIIRVCTIVEFQTVNQIYGPRPSTVAPLLIWDAQASLANFNSAMENDFHLKKIANKINTYIGKFGKFLFGAGNALALVAPEFGVPLSAIGMGATSISSAAEPLLN